MISRCFLWVFALVTVIVAGPLASQGVPVIFDTDIGTDIDDTWALALILASPELDLKLVLTDSGDTAERSRLAAKFLEVCGRSDVPIGIGVEGEPVPNHQSPWIEGYSLDDYPGKVYEDGVGAMIDLILESDRGVGLLAVGPVPNVAEALRREPRIVDKAFVVAMSGSVDKGYGGSTEASAEYNVRAAPSAARAMYGGGWDVIIAPLDTAGQVQIRGEAYQRLLASKSPCVEALLENYRIWNMGASWASHDPRIESSVLFDAVAVSLAYRPDFFEIESVRLEVTDDGYTRRSPSGSPVRAALGWKQDRDVFQEYLVARLAGVVVMPRPAR